jgi:hypothetical protein
MGQTETNRGVHVGFTPIPDINLARCKGVTAPPRVTMRQMSALGFLKWHRSIGRCEDFTSSASPSTRKAYHSSGLASAFGGIADTAGTDASSTRQRMVESECDAVALGSNISVAASFVWRCLSGSTMTPFSHPAHRTGHADLPHPALGQELTLSRATPSAVSDHLSELIGFPISKVLPYVFASVLN